MSFGAPPPGMDEYQRLMAERAAAAKRKRNMFALIALVVVGGGAFAFQRSAAKNKQAQEILDAAGRFAERDKSEMGAFWNCAMSSEVDVGMFNSADQIQQRIESAYFTQQKTYSDHLVEECVPKLKGAESALSSIPDLPSVLKPSLDKYLAALPKMETGLETYAEKLKTRGAVKDVDGAIQEVGGAFTADPTAQSVAFEKFLVCAVPDLEKKKDLQTLLQDLADVCKKDAVTFMTKVRTDCGSLVTGVDKDANAKGTPDKAFKGVAKKFIEEDNSRLLQAWEFCGKRSRKGKKVLDLEDFLLASSDYMEARGELVKTAREESARITGQPLPQEKEKPAQGAAP
jgi:hypothetical protein